MKIIKIENGKLSAGVSSFGAELVSLVNKENGREYIWQKDEKYWVDSAPNMFPVCGRLWGMEHTCKGKKYPMPLHGLLWKSELEIIAEGQDFVTFLFEANEETRKCFPWDFRLELTQKLCENRFVTTFKVTAPSEDICFSWGTHPGFNMPLEEGYDYEDYYIEFKEKCAPTQLVINDKGYVRTDIEFPKIELEDEKRLPLRRRLFETEAVFMRGAGNELSICRDGKAFVTMRYPGCHVTGLWTSLGGNAPFVCVETMHGSPDRVGDRCVLENKEDMVHLAAGGTYESSVEIEVV